jgi:3-deoxy-manno-octulosonate cytidylyltransferase (CMP-KDO synthetase)
MGDNVVAVIPARYGSTRFPGKPLALIAGKPMIQWVYERAAAARLVTETIVATDDRRIFDVVEGFGGRAAMTSPEHATGTDRIAEAVGGTDAGLVVNLQGDEPLLPSTVVDELVGAVLQSGAEMGTVAVPFGQSTANPEDPNAVKVVRDATGYALYFSRSLIPFHRQGGEPVQPLWHWGLYAYRRPFLEKFVQWPQGSLERCEMLEQLRALENGARILVVKVQAQSIGVDRPADIAEVERVLRERGEA